MSVRPSVRLSVRPSLKISVTTEPIGFYSSGNIPTGPVVVLGYFLGGWDTPNSPLNKKKPHPKDFFLHFLLNLSNCWSNWAQPYWEYTYWSSGGFKLFSWGVGHPNPPKNKKSPLPKFLIFKIFVNKKPVIGVGEPHCNMGRSPHESPPPQKKNKLNIFFLILIFV